jgi:chromosome partitioning protein
LAGFLILGHVVKKIVIAAHKGGSGKTTVAVNLAGALAAHGLRVLLVDTDPQGACAAALGIQVEKPTLYEVLLGQSQRHEAITGTGVSGLSLLPSDLDLAGAEVELPRFANWQQRLNEVLVSLESVCDVAIIDTPPGLGVLSYSALNAATGALVVCPPEFMAFRALPHLQEMTERAGVPLMGIVPTMATGTTRHAREVLEQLDTQYRALLLPAIPRRVALQDAALAGLPITEFEPSSDVAERFRTLAQEVLDRGKNVAA